MRARSIKDLSRLTDKKFFLQISLGYEQILKHAVSLDEGAQILAKQEHVKSNRVLSLIAEEEAAKCLILMDAVRCPRKPPELLSNHLWKFSSHLAKAIYSEACYVTPDNNNFAGLVKYVENECKEFYIDGQNDFDWIWRNRLEALREEAMYVDYVETDNGDHIWLLPLEHEFYLEDTSFALSLAKALYETGCTSASSLQAIAEFWREITIEFALTFEELRELNIQTLDILNKRDLLQEQPQSAFSTIIDLWTFPMYSLPMKIVPSNKEELREILASWIQRLETNESGG
ncbi:MAG: AbiV family abortive infection protein [Rubrivivax sp.]|nr:AbiV family abortive infection protein [Rubrivivax sp.]